MKRAAVAALLLLAATLFFVLSINSDRDKEGSIVHGPANEVPAQAALHAAATLTAEQDAVWERRPGEDLYAGQRFTLTHGFAEITTLHGALVVLEAPATIEIRGNNRVSLTRGTLIGHCPTITSRGFIVDTPSAQVVDIGTRFGVAVDPDGETSLEVFAGEVTVAPIVDGLVGDSVPLIANQAASIHLGAVGRVEPASEQTSSRFARALAFEQKHARIAFQSSILRDPTLILLYGFESPGGAVLRESRGESLFDAQIVGARWVEGRHPGKHALAFTGKAWEERVELSQDASERLGLQDAYTISMWVNLHDLSDDYGWNAILTKGNDDWRFLCSRNRKSGRTQIGFYRSKDEESPDSRYDGVVSDDIALNRWHHVVVTGQPQGDAVVTKLYIDGQLKSEKQFLRPLQSNQPVLFGAITDAKQPMVFDGEIGEVAFFNRAVPEDEVRQLFNISSFSGTEP